MQRLLSSALVGPLLIGTLVLSSSRTATAQSNSFNLNIAAGLTLPTGSFGDRADAGYNLIVGVGTTQPGSQLGFRVEGIYNEFKASSTGANSHVGGVTANAVFDLASGSRTAGNTLYVIGGAGYYNTSEPRFFGAQSNNNIGWNLGGGFRFPLSGFSAYLEARYHAVSNTDVKFVPVSFGLVF